MANKTIAERIATLESQHEDLVRWREAGHEEWLRAQEDIKKSFSSINEKLDDLISLRNKAMGAFLLATSGVIGAIAAFWNWAKHLGA